MENINYNNVAYLQYGNDKQKRAYHTLAELNIFEKLKEFSPILVGTIPIGIDTDNSDLDIACKVEDFSVFEKTVYEAYCQYTKFIIKNKAVDGVKAIVIEFLHNTFEIQIFGQAIQTENQNGYRHMIIEDRILRLAGSRFREKIIELKKNGMKTEPAFAKLLKIEGNPYKKLLELEDVSDNEILLLLSRELV